MSCRGSQSMAVTRSFKTECLASRRSTDASKRQPRWLAGSGLPFQNWVWNSPCRPPLVLREPIRDQSTLQDVHRNSVRLRTFDLLETESRRHLPRSLAAPALVRISDHGLQPCRRIVLAKPRSGQDCPVWKRLLLPCLAIQHA